MIAALYVETGGVYFGLPNVDPWDVARNAKLYDGPHPVVAHPPCGPWGIMRHLCTKQDGECGPLAVAAVRMFGGVLEHPEHSKLFRHCGMPLPGELADAWGGRTYRVDQVSWGHSCRKPTWIYVVCVDTGTVMSGLRAGGAPTHRVTSGPRGPKLPSATPPAFRDFLLSLARSAAQARGAA